MSNFWFFHKLEIWLHTKTRTRISHILTNHNKKLNFTRKKSSLSQKFDFISKNIKNSESPKMTSKVLYELLLTSYEQFLIFSQTRNLNLHKDTNKDQPKTNQLSQKVEFQLKKVKLKSKIRFYLQKYQKKWKSKNDLKSPLWALNKELWAI